MAVDKKLVELLINWQKINKKQWRWAKIASYLELDQSRMSLIVSKKRKVSLSHALKIAKLIGVNLHEIETDDKILQAENKMKDTIVACASGLVPSGVAIVRLSGEGVIKVAQTILKSRMGNIKERYAQYVKLWDGDRLLDKSIILYFKAPYSFTGENVIEFQVHGSLPIVERLIEICIQAGARLAEPGEFSERAFLNQKMDLTQAEALIDLINSKSLAQAQATQLALSGTYVTKINGLRNNLASLRVWLETQIDFSDQVPDTKDLSDVVLRLKEFQSEIVDLKVQTEAGILLNQSPELALMGRPNAGKSSLFNALLSQDRAMVSSQAGTTRDWIESHFQLGDYPLRLMDTAGIHSTESELEQEAIARSLKKLKEADWVIWVHDWAQKPNVAKIKEDIETYLHTVPVEKRLLVLNKSDESKSTVLSDKQINSLLGCVGAYTFTSVYQDDSLERFKAFIAQSIQVDSADINQFSARVRHRQCLVRCEENLREAVRVWQNTQYLDLLAEGIKKSLIPLDEITGRTHTQDLLGEIFSQFCIGK